MENTLHYQFRDLRRSRRRRRLDRHTYPYPAIPTDLYTRVRLKFQPINPKGESMFTQHLHHPRPRRSIFLLGVIFIGLLLLMGCEREGSSGGPGSPLKVRASISPEPI